MGAYIFNRVIQLVPVLWLISLIVFAVMHILPGDPAALMLAGAEGGAVTPQRLDELRQEMGLNDPLIVQYGRFLGNALLGDLGTSIRFRTEVTGLVLERFPSTLELALSGLFVALLIGVPLGVSCAVYIAEFASKRWALILKPSIELLAGIPSVVYGFIGMEVLVPFIRNSSLLGGPGYSALAASIILAVMVLPTIIGISIDAIEAVPRSYRDGSLALGATQWQTITGVVLPAARSGIVAGVILGMGRAVGETMAVIMVAGNSVQVPHSLLAPVRTLTANIALEMGYASGAHAQALFATGIVLFLISLALNEIAGLVRGRKRRTVTVPEATALPTGAEARAELLRGSEARPRRMEPSL
jgi:phosphate ABC transporter permease protein PstC